MVREYDTIGREILDIFANIEEFYSDSQFHGPKNCLFLNNFPWEFLAGAVEFDGWWCLAPRFWYEKMISFFSGNPPSRHLSAKTLASSQLGGNFPGGKLSFAGDFFNLARFILLKGAIGWRGLSRNGNPPPAPRRPRMHCCTRATGRTACAPAHVHSPPYARCSPYTRPYIRRALMHRRTLGRSDQH